MKKILWLAAAFAIVGCRPTAYEKEMENAPTLAPHFYQCSVEQHKVVVEQAKACGEMSYLDDYCYRVALSNNCPVKEKYLNAPRD